jgi:hypothetical protein
MKSSLDVKDSRTGTGKCNVTAAQPGATATAVATTKAAQPGATATAVATTDTWSYNSLNNRSSSKSQQKKE